MISLVDSSSSEVDRGTQFTAISGFPHGYNDDTIAVAQRLVRTVMFSSNQFSLVLGCCNCSVKRSQLLSIIDNTSPAEIVEMKLHPSVKYLYTHIANHCKYFQPKALMVTGLESVVDISQLLISANLMRDEFAKQFEFPIILWVNDEIIRKMIKLAPDFKDWSTTFRFNANVCEQNKLALSA